MIILRDFPHDSALFGLVILITPVFWSKGPGYPKDPDISPYLNYVHAFTNGTQARFW